MTPPTTGHLLGVDEADEFHPITLSERRRECREEGRSGLSAEQP